jgi:formylglycine-generating enzyme required for sulfatase activity
MELVKIEPGNFRMGSPASEAERDNDEGPEHQVTIRHGFWMGKYEVTQGQYQAVMGNNPSSFKGSTNLPVENVSWVDAANFCGKLTEQERAAGRVASNQVYRLPAEAEWEYACRAGSTSRFGYGDDPGYIKLGQYAWFGDNAGRQTHPVGGKSPNAWGLYDLHGNVYEWCLDRHGVYPGGSVDDPKGPDSGSFRVIRGGSWNNNARNCRSANRNNNDPTNRNNNLGFRVALAPAQPERRRTPRLTRPPSCLRDAGFRSKKR